MKTFLWYSGRTLQLLGLLIAPYAFYIGISTQDARRELTLLAVAVLQFLLGLWLTKVASK